VACALGEQREQQQLQVSRTQLAAAVQAVEAGAVRVAGKAVSTAETREAAVAVPVGVVVMMMAMEGIMDAGEEGVHVGTFNSIR
jgi:hypothetical protein